MDYERRIAMIRRHRARALVLYDRYEVKVMRGKITEDPAIEEWYNWMLDFPATYDHNKDYYEQLMPVPEALLKFR